MRTTEWFDFSLFEPGQTGLYQVAGEDTRSGDPNWSWWNGTFFCYSTTDREAAIAAGKRNERSRAVYLGQVYFRGLKEEAK